MTPPLQHTHSHTHTPTHTHSLPAHSYGGFNKAGTCPRRFPKTAPWNICSHIAFVEMDGQMSYKQVGFKLGVS